MVQGIDELREEAARLGSRAGELAKEVQGAEKAESELAVALERRQADLAGGRSTSAEVLKAENAVEVARRTLAHVRAALSGVEVERQRADHLVLQAEREIGRRKANEAAEPVRAEAERLLGDAAKALAHPGALLAERATLALKMPPLADPLPAPTLDGLAAAVLKELSLDGNYHWAVKVWIQKVLAGPVGNWQPYHPARFGLGA